MSRTRPSALRAAGMSALRGHWRISSLVVPMAIAGTMSLTLGHSSTHNAIVATLTDWTQAGGTSDARPVPLPMPGGATTDQFAGPRQPTPPQPV